MVPVMPGAAKEASEDGARAFVGYYWELVNYAQATGDVRRLRRVSGPRCDGCRSGIAGIDKLYRDGGRLEGGAYSLTIATLDRLPSKDPSNLAYEGLLTVRNDEQLIVRGDGQTDKQKASVSSVAIIAYWIAGHWRLEAMEVRS